MRFFHSNISVLACFFGLFTLLTTPLAKAAQQDLDWIMEFAPLQGLWGYPSLRAELPLGNELSVGLGYNHYRVSDQLPEATQSMRQTTGYRTELIWYPYDGGFLAFNVSLGVGGKTIDTTNVYHPPRNRFGENQDPFDYHEHIRSVILLQAVTLRARLNRFWTVGLRGEIVEVLNHHSKLSWGDEVQYTGAPPPGEKKSEFGSPSLSLKIYTGLAI